MIELETTSGTPGHNPYARVYVGDDGLYHITLNFSGRRQASLTAATLEELDGLAVTLCRAAWKARGGAAMLKREMEVEARGGAAMLKREMEVEARALGLDTSAARTKKDVERLLISGEDTR